jgi:hypothetical protein
MKNILIFKILDYFFKAFVAFVATYLAVAYLYYVLKPPVFNYRESDLLNQNVSVILQPSMDLFAAGKVSHWYDWSEISYQDFDSVAEPVNIRTSTNIRDFKKQISTANAFATLGGVSEAVILEPVKKDIKWSLVFCLEDYSFCQQSNILYSGKIKILADGNQKAWGKDQAGNLIQLRLVEYINRNEKNEILHI